MRFIYGCSDRFETAAESRHTFFFAQREKSGSMCGEGFVGLRQQVSRLTADERRGVEHAAYVASHPLSQCKPVIAEKVCVRLSQGSENRM